MLEDSFKFLPLKEEHLPWLLKWLETPHVKAWWDRDIAWTMDLIQQKYGCYIQGFKIVDGQKKPLQAYIVYVNDTPVGYIQLYNTHDFAREDGLSIEELPASLAAFDIFIGDPDYVGKGYGTSILNFFFKNYVDPKYEFSFVYPDSDNIAAVRTYEKVGFKRIETRSDDKVIWMLRERDAL